MPTQERLRKDLLGGALTTALGVFTLGIGVYFLFLRPSLLPEDIRHTGIDAATLPVAFTHGTLLLPLRAGVAVQFSRLPALLHSPLPF